METKNVNVTLEKAMEWYKKGGDLKEVALQAFTEDELKSASFKCITTMADVLCALNIDNGEFTHALKHLEKHSKASAAAYKLNLIRRALNLGQKMDFKKGTIWYPYTPAVPPNNSYCKDSWEVEVAKVRIGCDTFTLLGGHADYSADVGLGSFASSNGVANSFDIVGFLGCATKEIAQHMGKYFGKEIFEAKYGDLVDFEWV